MGTRLDYVNPPEQNPYPAVTPVSVQQLDLSLFTFLSTLLLTVREQHEKAQAGDTTFPWQRLTELSDSQQFNLGSLGRFYHPVHGLIFARYVKYVVANPGIWTGAPVGYVMDPSGFKWLATTKLSASDKKSVIGLAGAYKVPVEGQFGWVIVNGINLQSVTYNGNEPPEVGTELNWHSDAKVAQKQAGGILGQVVSLTNLIPIDQNNWDIAPGCIRVEIENHREDDVQGFQGFTPEELELAVSQLGPALGIGQINAAIQQLQQLTQAQGQAIAANQLEQDNVNRNITARIQALAAAVQALSGP